jgi:hypothetical protein
MEINLQPSSTSTGWTYTEIVVYDGDRILKPTHLCSDEITFRDPPALMSAEINIRITNGDRQTTRTARVLPHESGATRVPIQLIQTEQKTSAKLTA